MKITGVEVTDPIRIAYQKPRTDAINYIPLRSFAAVKVFTDEGVVGLSPSRGNPVIRTIITDSLRNVVVGEDPFDVERIWDKMYWQVFNMGRKGAGIIALSEVDIAIWDIIGKSVGRPLFQLLGGYRDVVPAYGSGIDLSWSIDDLVKEHTSFVEQGFRAVKMKIGRKDPDEDLTRVKAVRDAIGYGVKLMVDANNGWGVNHAIKMARRLERYEVSWLEEPVIAEDVKGLAKVASATEIPIAVGESEYTKWGFRQLFEAEAVDIVQADVGKVGGITEWRKIASMAQAWNLPMAPHAQTHVSAHLVASVPNGLIVEVFEPIPGFNYFKGLVKAKQGMIHLPRGSGLGVEIDEEAIKNIEPVPETLSRRTSPPYP